MFEQTNEQYQHGIDTTERTTDRTSPYATHEWCCFTALQQLKTAWQEQSATSTDQKDV